MLISPVSARSLIILVKKIRPRIILGAVKIIEILILQHFFGMLGAPIKAETMVAITMLCVKVLTSLKLVPPFFDEPRSHFCGSRVKPY